jgi:hypothetical protein
MSPFPQIYYGNKKTFLASIFVFLIIGLCMYPVARVSINIYIYRNLRTQQMSVLVFCALLTLHVSAPIGGHLQVVL